MMQQQKNISKYTISTLLILFLMIVLFTGCDQVQQLLVPVPELEDGGAIKIGFIYSTPRPKTTRYGAELAASQLNAEGGVRGTPIQLIARDDRNNTERSIELAKALITEERVLAIVGPDWSVHAFEVSKVAQAHGIPMITTYPTNPNVPNVGDFVFMAAFTDNRQGKPISDFAITPSPDGLGATTTAILTQRDLAYSEGLSTFFKTHFTRSGGMVVAHEFYTAGDTDFTAQLTAIAESAPDIIFLPGLLPEIPLVVKQARELGITTTFLGGDGWDDPDLIAIGGTALEGSFFSNHFSPSPDLDEDARQFIAAYTEMFGVAPDGPASLGYDALRLMVQAMRRADELTPQTIRDQIAATENYRGAMNISGYDENRHAIKGVVINRISDGEIQFYQLIEP